MFRQKLKLPLRSTVTALAVGAVCSAQAPAAQTASRLELVNAATQQLSLEIAGRIVSTRYCRGGDAETATLFLEVQFTARNRGDQVIVLPTDSLLLTKVVVGRDEEALKKGDYVSVVPLHPSMAGRARLALDDFDTVRPGGEVRFGRSLSVPILFARPGHSVINMPGPGSYLAGLTLSLWPYGPRTTREWPARLQLKGSLWTLPVDVVPIAFSIDGSASSRDCGEFH